MQTTRIYQQLTWEYRLTSHWMPLSWYALSVPLNIAGCVNVLSLCISGCDRLSRESTVEWHVSMACMGVRWRRRWWYCIRTCVYYTPYTRFLQPIHLSIQYIRSLWPALLSKSLVRLWFASIAFCACCNARSFSWSSVSRNGDVKTEKICTDHTCIVSTIIDKNNDLTKNLPLNRILKLNSIVYIYFFRKTKQSNRKKQIKDR